MYKHLRNKTIKNGENKQWLFLGPSDLKSQSKDWPWNQEREALPERSKSQDLLMWMRIPWAPYAGRNMSNYLISNFD